MRPNLGPARGAAGGSRSVGGVDDVGIDPAAPAHFDAAFRAALAGQQQIDLGAGLGEGQEARTEPPLRLGPEDTETKIYRTPLIPSDALDSLNCNLYTLAEMKGLMDGPESAYRDNSGVSSGRVVRKTLYTT